MKQMVLGFVVLASTVGAFSEKYEPNWKSLSKHEAAPEWMKDAKLGIYFHWGVYCVPAYWNEWYPSKMHIEGDDVFYHHKKTYGDPSEFGYHDFIPDFTGEHFDPEEWADLFQKTGARFAGPVAEHHDGYAMWASKVTPWNSMDTGPKRDILGELFQSLEKRDMKTIATFHHARNLQRYADTWDEGGRGWDSHYRYNPKWPTASEDPELRLLYGNVPEDEWNETIWLGKLKEVIDNYQPDIIWFDSWLDSIPEEYRKRFSAYYLNEAEKWGKDVVIIRKQNDLPLDYTMNDHEKSREPKALPELWMTDDTISKGSWSYTENLEIKPVYKVVHALIDTVAKNGVVLLNISPKADGTIPQNQRDVMLGLGEWLDAHGEAIYETRPWIIAAEGPTAEPDGGFSDRKKFLNLEYSDKDIRYTASKDGKTVYAIMLGIPEAGEKRIFEAFKEARKKATNVELLDGSKVKWANGIDGLKLTIPELEDNDGKAVVFKVTLR